MVRRWKPKIVFLMETKSKAKRMEKIKNRIGFANGLIVPSRGRSGGVAMLWTRDVFLDISSYSGNHIDAVVRDLESNLLWRITGFYGYPETHRRYESWRLLAFLHNQFQLPWLCIGDFNEILSINEKQGGITRSQQQMEGFRNIVNFCGFRDLGYRGADFTWCNMQDEENRIQLRLDRALANTDWIEKFEGMRVYHLVDSTSDHCVFLLTNSHPQRVSKNKRFHFEALWTNNEDCRNIIESSWGMGVDLSTPEGMMENLKRCASDLSNWSSSVYGHIPKKIQSKRKALSALTLQDRNGERSTEIRNLRRELNGLLEDEELYWGQRAKAHWLKEGDRNTKFFHAHASERRKQNTILGLWVEQGRWCEEKDAISQVVVTYFENIYSTSFPTGIEDVVGAIPTKVSEDMNADLSRAFTREEVATALKQIHPTKAPGPDGMSAIFYQKYWSIVGNNVTDMVLNVFNNNLPMTEINKTIISLIPKTSSLKKMTDFRPISLCNVIYKLISKTLANRLKILLPHIISENQSAFTSKRLITDNLLVAFELMNYLNHKTAGKEGYMAIKLDMSKAFDRVEWGFIKRIMEKLGFCSNWVSLIMQCITSVSYSVQINGVTYGNIIPSRGLRQGDPLSPSLFLLCAEGLSAIIHDAARNLSLTGISVSRNCPSITHLFFADDSILFCKANTGECQELKRILQRYETASGQKINTDKSSVFFSPNTHQDTKETILAILGPMQDSRHSKYLGLPSLIERSKNQVFSLLKERVGQKLAGWKGKLLSMGGKEILIKAVAQAIPTYTMSCFQLPRGLCEDLESMMRKFWWGQKHQETKMAWVGWKQMCFPKSLGGLGFRNLQAFNLAMLAKQAWRILTNPTSLLARVLKARDILCATLGTNPSYSWQSIFNSLEVIRKGTRWCVGNGKKIHIWDDKWLPTPTTYKVITSPNNLLTFPMVSSLIDPSTKWWRADTINATFLPFEAETILRIPLSRSLLDDKLIWMGNRRGVFTVKSAYHIAHCLVENKDVGGSSMGDPFKPLWKRLWLLNLPSKIKIFAWRACVNRLPSKEKMCSRGINTSSECPLCNKEIEFTHHALLHCKFAIQVWSHWPEGLQLIQRNFWSFPDLAMFILTHKTSQDLELFFSVAWAIWYNRNRTIHEGLSASPTQIWQMASCSLEEFSAAAITDLSSPRPALSNHWSPPPPSVFKINVDGASSDLDGTSNIGVIIRDCKGEVIAALCKPLQSH
ncbi:hypothetical protein SO802_011842 [Lithocarpus litseifolius]|uniref:Reverse transcriptase domain-containing protein n=1 Tax=Lithocarpus litseifolius TaxID=425828 RepID=A0AAW2D6J2_9ROSI